MVNPKYISLSKTFLWISFGSSLLFFGIGVKEKTFENYIYTFLISSLYTFSYGLSNGLLNDYLDQRFSWTENTKNRAVISIICMLILNIGLTFALNFINFVYIRNQNPNDFFSRMNFTNWFMINFALLITAFLHAKGFMLALKQNAKKEIIEHKIIASTANAQLESLKNQLDPHFLFNSLNVLSALIDENPNQAQNFTAGMSKIYRYVLEQKDKELVSVADEIDFAKTYADLLKTRFEDAVNFEYQIDENLQNYWVVPLSLQLLLENVIKHNFATSNRPLFIKIYTHTEQLIIENNIQKRETANHSTGVGLANIVSRYHLLTDRNVLIEESDVFFRVKIPILTQKISAMQEFTPTQEQIAYEKASKRVEELKGFYGNLISYFLFMPFLVIINITTSPNYHWFYWPLLGWGIGVIAHAIKTFGIGTDWEERQIKKYMQKKENNSKKWK